MSSEKVKSRINKITDVRMFHLFGLYSHLSYGRNRRFIKYSVLLLKSIQLFGENTAGCIWRKLKLERLKSTETTDGVLQCSSAPCWYIFSIAYGGKN